MTFSDRQTARERRAFAAAALRAVPRLHCPAPARLWDAIGGRLTAEEVRALVAHTASCPSCAEDWRLARELAPQATGTVAGFPGRRSRPLVRWGLAAAAVLVALVTVPLWRDSSGVDSGETVRTATGSAVIRALIDEGVPLSRTDCVLSWSAESEPVGGYDLLVATGDLEVLVRKTGLERPSYRVPEEALSRLAAGDKILWRVEATLADGRRAVSPTFVHRLQ